MSQKRKAAGAIACLLLLLGLTACGQVRREEGEKEPSGSAAASIVQTAGEKVPESGGTAAAPEISDVPSVPDAPEVLDAPEVPAEPEDDSLAELRRAMAAEDLCAAAFLGVLENDGELSALLEESGYLEEYPFLAEIPQERRIGLDGTELYCIVPGEETASVTVREWVVEKGDIVSGPIHYQNTAGEPLLVWGNFSDVAPNIRLVITREDGTELDYTPCLSLKDGSLCVPDHGPSVLDFTRYENGEGDSIA